MIEIYEKIVCKKKVNDRSMKRAIRFALWKGPWWYIFAHSASRHNGISYMMYNFEKVSFLLSWQYHLCTSYIQSISILKRYDKSRHLLMAIGYGLCLFEFSWKSQTGISLYKVFLIIRTVLVCKWNVDFLLCIWITKN